MPQMAPCWWLMIQLFVLMTFMMVFIEIYFNCSPSASVKHSLPGEGLSSSFKLVNLLNE